jgi:parallel beta-helix repeat protein
MQHLPLERFLRKQAQMTFMPFRSWTRLMLIPGLFAGLLLASAGDAAASCLNGLAVQAVSAGNDLYDIMLQSTPPCTLNVGPGTYAAPAAGTPNFTIPAGITVRSTGGPSVTTLQVTAPAFSDVSIWPVNNSCPSGATLDGFTLTGGSWGVYVGASSAVGHPGCGASSQVTGVTLRNLIVYTSSTSSGHGIELHSVQNSVIDTCTVEDPYGNGIFLETGSNNNIVMNSTILNTQTQHAIAVQGSNDNVIVGNTISGAAFDGIILNSSVSITGPGSLRNRIERNSISGHKIDGIVLDQGSVFNYVGLNTAVSGSYVPGSSTPPVDASGTGIWVNNGSNGSYLYGNDVSGSPENGMDILTSTSTFLVANMVHGNYQGGIWVANDAFSAAPNAVAPQNTVLQGNRSFFNTFNAQLFLQGAINTEASYNYFSGAQAGTLAAKTTVAIQVQDSGGANIFENTVTQVSARAMILGATTNTVLFRNRFVTGTNIPNPPETDGLNGVTYLQAPAGVVFDGGSVLGGNHWNEFTAATANPDPNHPYTGFIVVNSGGGPYVDRFPYASESLQTSALPNSVTVVEPVAGSVLAATTRKTIRWVGRGCALVDIYYGSAVNAPSLITSGYPNVGYYFWTVPAVALRADYYAQVVCKDSNGVPLGVSGNSPSFTIASSDLVLLNPGRVTRAVDDSVLRVAWKASAAVTGVNIFVKAGFGAETQVATDVTGTSFADITLPAAVSDSSAVTVRIQDAATNAHQDSVDGYFMVRGAAPSIGTNLSAKPLQIGSIHILEWTGMSTSYTVDLDLVDQVTTSIAKNLPDVGSYTWLVSVAPSSQAKIRATFMDANGNTVGTADTGTVSAPPFTSADFDGNGKTDIAVYRPSAGTWEILKSSTGFTGGAVYQWGVSTDVPVPADYDGDGQTDIAVYRPSTGNWFILKSSTNYTTQVTYQWGMAGDIPVPGDYDGDGKTDLAVYRPSNGTWYILTSSSGYTVGEGYAWGASTDKPEPGDYDGDGKTDLAVYRPATGNWFILKSSTGYTTWGTYQWGTPGDIPVASDYDGDGITDLAVYRPSSGSWYILTSSSGFTAGEGYAWGAKGDVPVPADYDGDGKTDLAVYRPSTGNWFILLSSTDYTTWDTYQWGTTGDIPVLGRQ